MKVMAILSALVVCAVFALLFALMVNVFVLPPPHCPDGYTIAGGGYGGRVHCVVGVDPIR